MTGAVVEEGWADARWCDASWAAALFAVDPVGTGVLLRALAGPVRVRWLALLRRLLPAGPMRTIPLNVPDSRLLGGLDLAATLQAGRPIAERGILAEADGGMVLLAMAERLSSAAAARIAGVIDQGAVTVARDGLVQRHPARIGVVAVDEGMDDDEHAPAALADRLMFHVKLSDIGARVIDGPLPGPAQVAAARSMLPLVRASDEVLDGLCVAAAALGIASVRAPLLALRAARAAAALAGRDTVLEADAALACRLVLAPRATMLPVPEPQTTSEPQVADTPSPQAAEAPEEAEAQPMPDTAMQDMLIQAAKAAIPAGLLAQLTAGDGPRSRASTAGAKGALQNAGRRGRPVGTRPGDPRSGARLDLIATLRAAAPWQRLRQRDAAGRVEIRRDDFRVTRSKQRAETTTIFVVDASGSQAFNRLAEAKGAVELLLADCYVRRDRVAVLAFRGAGAQILLPPTRSLVRAKRSLAGLPGGGGTPLAAGIDAGFVMADGIRRRGGTPTIVLLTDGRANVGQDGKGGRVRADADAMAAARQVRAARLTALLVDTSPRPHPASQRLAAEMDARYVPLPYANAAALTRAVRAAA
jgi:magnesium chelatase subunit D